MRAVQLTFMDTDETQTYKEFVEKFKPKKTTDDCYTPQPVYEAVASWVEKEYGVDRSNFVRPFYPGGDYEQFDYKSTDIVVDNPPFSILAQIKKFYLLSDIRFFLFAPYLTCISTTSGQCCAIACNAQIIYENGANVNTCFITNMEDTLLRSAPDLRKAVMEAAKTKKPQNPKYTYPDELITSTDVGYMATHGIEYTLNRGDGLFVRSLDSQITQDKEIFGGGYLISERAAAERAAAERAAAERAAAERAAATVWKLSERERHIIEELGQGKYK